MKNLFPPRFALPFLVSAFLWLGLSSSALSQENSPELMQRAEAGDAESQYQLSRLYKLGQSLPEDQGEAAKWELKAADQGHLEAQFMLGARLMAGLGRDGKREPLQAAKWLNLAANGGHPKASGVLRYVQSEMTPAQIAEAEKLAEAWKPVGPPSKAPGADNNGEGKSPGKMQTWVSSDGRTIRAEWVRLEGAVVSLKRNDGLVFQVPLNKLSAESQTAAKHQASGTPMRIKAAEKAVEVLDAVDGKGNAARFDLPTGIARDRNGNLYVSDRRHHTIRKITPAGEVTTLAGRTGMYGDNDGIGSAARFESPFHLAIAPTGDLYVVDLNSTVRKISITGEVTTLAGKAGVVGSEDGAGTVARFHKPEGVAVDKYGILYIADTYNHTIRKVSGTGTVITFAGSPGKTGSQDGLGHAARFRSPKGLAVDGNGNVYVADHSNHTIRKITAAGMVTTLAGTAGNIVSKDGTGPGAVFEFPTGVAVDSVGHVYVTDSLASTIRKITPSGVVTTLAASRARSGSADGKGIDAKFSYPDGITLDGSGNLYVADSVNNLIRKITKDGVVTTIAGKAP